MTLQYGLRAWHVTGSAGVEEIAVFLCDCRPLDAILPNIVGPVSNAIRRDDVQASSQVAREQEV